MNAKLIGVDEVCEQLNVSRAYAYKVIRKLNAEMQGNGCLVVPEKVNRMLSQASITASIARPLFLP